MRPSSRNMLKPQSARQAVAAPKNGNLAQRSAHVRSKSSRKAGLDHPGRHVHGAGAMRSVCPAWRDGDRQCRLASRCRGAGCHCCRGRAGRCSRRQPGHSCAFYGGCRGFRSRVECLLRGSCRPAGAFVPGRLAGDDRPPFGQDSRHGQRFRPARHEEGIYLQCGARRPTGLRAGCRRRGRAAQCPGQCHRPELR